MFYRPNSMWTWTFVVITVLEIVTVLTVEGKLYSDLDSSILGKLSRIDRHFANVWITIPTYRALFIVGFVCQIMLAYDTLAKKNSIQLFGFCLYTCSLGVYAALQVVEIDLILEALETSSIAVDFSHRGQLRSLAVANAIIIGIYTLAICFISFKLYAEFQWTIYRQLNADVKMQRRYFTFKIYVVLLKFDFFFFWGFLSQNFVQVRSMNSTDYAFTIVCFPVSLTTLAASAWFMRRENKTGMLVVLCLHLALLGFFLYKYVHVYSLASQWAYLSSMYVLRYFGLVTIILGFTTIAMAIKCMQNFGQGLKVHVTGHRLAQTLLKDHEMEMSAISIK